MSLPSNEYFTLHETAIQLGCSETQLHHFIANGKIVPALRLSEPEAYIDGVWNGGTYVGDIDNAVFTVFDRDWAEQNGVELDDMPRCNRIVYCHNPEPIGSNDYRFQFFSESAGWNLKTCQAIAKNPPEHPSIDPDFADPPTIKRIPTSIRWFPLNNTDLVKDKSVGLERFLFFPVEIKRFQDECKMAAGRTKKRKALPPDTATIPPTIEVTWQESARMIADEIDLRDKKNGAYDSQTHISNRVASEMQVRNIEGPRGPVSGPTILREALSGGKWKRRAKIDENLL